MEWSGDKLRMLDQTRLPQQECWLELHTWQDVSKAIKNMSVRGAPAIGIAAAYGMALAAKMGANRDEAAAGLGASRPTAVNLFWALDRIGALPEWSFEKVLEEAKTIELEDLQSNLGIGHHGNSLIENGACILTVCNTGSIATSGHGTALGIIRTAFYEGKELFVYACETRPRLQGLRLTAWELQKEGIPFRSIADGAAASLMRVGKVDCVITGADRIAANGDTANKIGTYSLAVLARHHGVPFYVAAPSSTLDPLLPSGDLIPIEERSAEEITMIEGKLVAPEGCPAYNPAFDMTPGELITAIVTEEGVFRPPYRFMPSEPTSPAVRTVSSGRDR